MIKRWCAALTIEPAAGAWVMSGNAIRKLAEVAGIGGALAIISVLSLNYLGVMRFAGPLRSAPELKGNVIFFDDFLESSIDPAKWTVLDRLSDQVNKEINCVTPANVSVRDGMLAGVSKHESHLCGDSLEAPRLMPFTSWQIQQATPSFLYGRVEVRAKMPGGVGIWPTVFMLGFEWQASQPQTANVVGHKWPHAGWSEIDIAEFWQGSRRTVNTTIHFNRQGRLNLRPLTFDAAKRFAVYRLDWTKNALIWSVDPEDGGGFRRLYSMWGTGNVPDVSMYIVINAAIGGHGGGEPDPRTFPQTFLIDYVRVTQ